MHFFPEINIFNFQYASVSFFLHWNTNIYCSFVCLLNCIQFGYKTAVTIACFKNNEELTEHLLENSANSCLQNSDEKNILEMSLHSCNLFRIYE